MTPTQAKELAVDMRLKAVDVLFHAHTLDISKTVCACCGAGRNNNWPQKQLHDQMIGAAERLNTIAATLERRANDVYFLTGKDSDGQK